MSAAKRDVLLRVHRHRLGFEDNAGSARVRACGCVPAIPETQADVASILGLVDGAGDPDGAGAGALEIRLVR